MKAPLCDTPSFLSHYWIAIFIFSKGANGTYPETYSCARNISTVLCIHEPVCDPPDCHGHGQCIMGLCHCHSNYIGASCKELQCGTLNCTSHGICTPRKLTSITRNLVQQSQFQDCCKHLQQTLVSNQWPPENIRIGQAQIFYLGIDGPILCLGLPNFNICIKLAWNCFVLFLEKM